MVLRCCGFLFVSIEDTDDADVEVFDVVDEVRCKDDASEDTVDNRVSGRATL
jgi:hypothetical protein